MTGRDTNSFPSTKPTAPSDNRSFLTLYIIIGVLSAIILTLLLIYAYICRKNKKIKLRKKKTANDSSILLD